MEPVDVQTKLLESKAKQLEDEIDSLGEEGLNLSKDLEKKASELVTLEAHRNSLKKSLKGRLNEARSQIESVQPIESGESLEQQRITDPAKEQQRLHQEQIQKLDQEKKDALAENQRFHEEQLAKLKLDWEREIVKLNKEKQDALDEQQRLHDEHVKKLNQEKQAEFDAQKRSHEGEIDEFKRRHQTALEEQNRVHDDQLAQSTLDHQRESRKHQEEETALRARIQALADAVQFQVTLSHPQDPTNVELVDEVVGLVAESKKPAPSQTLGDAIPTLTVAASRSHRLHSRSPDYSLWHASQSGSIEEILENAEVVFNRRPILQEHAIHAKWIQNSLQHLVSRFIQRSGDTRVAIIVLQGVAFLRSMTPSYDPTVIMESISGYVQMQAQDSILASVYQKVEAFVANNQPIGSWTPPYVEGRVLDENSSALAAGMALITDTTGMFMLYRAAEEKSATYAFTKESVQRIEVTPTEQADLVLRSHHGLPVDLRRSVLMVDMSPKKALKWIVDHLFEFLEHLEA